MNTGKTLFAQLMDFVPWSTFSRLVKRRAFRRVMDGTPTEKRGGAPSGVKRLVGELNSLTITSAATREFVHPLENRPLTLRETARIQSFPDRYRFCGGAASVARQIGNAFPPMVARIMAEHIAKIDGSFGADQSNNRPPRGALIGYRLTESFGMSPALATTHALLGSLRQKQTSFEFTFKDRTPA
jgi:DNA (cytosine-5)-methyltransferase 1